MTSARRNVDAACRYHRPARSLPFADLSNRQSLINYKVQEPEYRRLYDDPYRHRYLRVHMHGLPPTADQILRPAYADVPWSLLILNEQFERVGKIDFFPDFDPQNLLITRRGVWINHNRPERPGYQSSALRCQLFSYSPVQTS